jgi:hypothetical protein
MRGRAKQVGSRHVILTGLLLVGGSGCSLGMGAAPALFGPADAETPVAKRPLPETPPVPHRLEFAGIDESGHVKPKTVGATAPAGITRTVSPAAFTTDQIGALRQAAEANPRVAAMLGERWTFVEADRLLAPGKASFGCCMESFRQARLLYFSYSHNVAVEVQMQDATVIAVSRREGYIPPEGDQDVRKAVELARGDRRLSGNVGGLEGHGIMMEPKEGIIWNDPGYGHRVMWVTFSQGQDGDPKFWAVVDLTADKVLDAGAEPPR